MDIYSGALRFRGWGCSLAQLWWAGAVQAMQLRYSLTGMMGRERVL